MGSSAGAVCGQMAQSLSWESFVRKVQAVKAPAIIVDQESSAPPGQSPPERMAADMQVMSPVMQTLLEPACLSRGPG